MWRPVDRSSPILTREHFGAVLFALDGVLVATATVHARCWKRLFDEVLGAWAPGDGDPLRPFDVVVDYRRHIDGKSRYDGVRGFLASRGIDLPYGDPSDCGRTVTVCGLGNRHDEMVAAAVTADGVETYADAVALVHHVARLGMKSAVVSSSPDCEVVLRAAGIAGLFAVRMDGGLAEGLGLASKPAPDTYLAAAARLDVPPQRAVVIDDTVAGARAGRAGSFGLVIGVERQGDHAALRQNGADIVVRDLRETFV
jgi:beta-phosphoglucomutase-like phosphatase (HAD superfamily)